MKLGIEWMENDMQNVENKTEAQSKVTKLLRKYAQRWLPRTDALSQMSRLPVFSLGGLTQTSLLWGV
jgi:hypothetical protein